MCSTQIQAQTTLQISALTERSGSNAQIGSSFADGFADYLSLLNQRDGGVGGARIVLEECDTAGNPAMLEQCYEKIRNSGSLAISSWSTIDLRALTIKTNTDQIPFLSAGQGLSVSAVGQYLPWSFAYPATPWSQLSAILGYINTVNDLRGQKIGFLFPDTDYGNEPLVLLDALSKEFKFEIAQYPTRVEDVLDQSLQWFHIRKGQPDWIIIWDDGAMSAAAIKHAINIRFPKDRIVGNTLSGSQTNLLSVGKSTNGFLAVNYTAIGQNFPAIQQILKRVVEDGNGKVSSRNNVGNVFYNRGVLSAVILAEAISVAQDKTDNAKIKRTDMRYGLENIDLNSAKFTELGLSGFAADIIGTCQDHEGGSVYIQQWSGSDWQQRSKYITAAGLFSRTLLEEAAVAFVTKSNGWETPPCS